MSRPLDQITLQGFKSIRELKDFPLKKINMLVGANGAGKSNFVDFFRLLRAMAGGNLREFVTKSGGADGFFFKGPKETVRIFAQLSFNDNAFRFTLKPTADAEILVADQATFWKRGRNPRWIEHGGGGKESSLKDWKGDQSKYGPFLSVQGYIYDDVVSWVVYHFHDTSSLAPMRRDSSLRDHREFRSDASNIAPFLYAMQNSHPGRYQRIRETIQLIAPFFDDFLLEPETKGDNEVMRLQWHQKGSTFPFQPWQFSDGTIRFICLATALLQPKPPSTIVIDEPELGLHPFALEALSALIHEASQQTQLVVSTQSAPLLDHFDADQVIVVERSEDASTFRRIDREDLENWLDDYSLGELVRKNIIETGPKHG